MGPVTSAISCIHRFNAAAVALRTHASPRTGLAMLSDNLSVIVTGAVTRRTVSGPGTQRTWVVFCRAHEATCSCLIRLRNRLRAGGEAFDQAFISHATCFSMSICCRGLCPVGTGVGRTARRAIRHALQCHGANYPVSSDRAHTWHKCKGSTSPISSRQACGDFGLAQSANDKFDSRLTRSIAPAIAIQSCRRILFAFDQIVDRPRSLLQLRRHAILRDIKNQPTPPESPSIISQSYSDRCNSDPNPKSRPATESSINSLLPVLQLPQDVIVLLSLGPKYLLHDGTLLHHPNQRGGRLCTPRQP